MFQVIKRRREPVAWSALFAKTNCLVFNVSNVLFDLEPRTPQNVHDPGKNVRDFHDDPGGSLRQRQSFPQQHPRGGRRPVHQRPTKFPGIRGETYESKGPIGPKEG